MNDTLRPDLSFVVTSRNDAEEALRKTQLFLDSLLAQVERFGLHAEIIVVEWNPPDGCQRLNEVLRVPHQRQSCKVRVIEVSPEIHQRFKNSDVIPLFQMIAKNVGIRRAHGHFVLATNIDILFSNELIEFLSSKKLQVDRMYRVDRFDVPSVVPENLTLDERLEWCSRSISRIYRYRETVQVRGSVIPPPKSIRASISQKLEDWIMKREPPLHTNACGDFTLLSSDYWMKVAGNPEFPVRAMKLDGLLCYAAHYAGARQEVLADPMRIYHLEHSARGDGALAALSDRSSESPDLQLSLNQYQTWVNQMRRSGHPIVFNTDGWGLIDENLPETIVS